MHRDRRSRFPPPGFVRVRAWLAFAAVFLGAAQTARAAKYDVDLARLTSSANGVVQPRYGDFRSLSSELGTLLAPRPMDPADSLGLAGFAFSADVTVNTLGGRRSYWRDATDGSAGKVAPSLQLMGRKGLYPGIELGAGANHLFDSRMWSMGGYVKLALHEGFHHLPIPSIALRGSFARLLGAKDFVLTTAAVAVTVSHVFGVGKTVSLTPYVGYETLFIVSRSAVLSTPATCDPVLGGTECAGPTLPASEFAFDNAGVIVRHRPHLGLRMMFSVMRLGFEAMMVPGGRREGEVDGQEVADRSSFQQQYTFSVGLDF